MKLSYVIVTYNRREKLLSTLEYLSASTSLPRKSWEVWVIDNASDDGTAAAVAARFPGVNLVRNSRNEGMAGRNHALRRARGEYVLTLDDDSYPIDDAVPKVLGYLDAHSRTAAVVGRVVLPDGRFEASALPGVMIGNASCLRSSVLEKVGYFPREFFRQAEEYDLSFRIWKAGYSVDRFEDIVYQHDKVPGGRASALVHRLDMRNNMILVERYLPSPARKIYRHDWLQRYGALARQAGCGAESWRGYRQSRWWAFREMLRGRRRVLGAEAFEDLFQWNQQEASIGTWAKEHRVRRVALADFSKNVHATFRGCLRAGLEIVNVAEANPAYCGLEYRGVPIVPDAEAFQSAIDGVVLSTVSPALVERRLETLRAIYSGEILSLWEPRRLSNVE